MLSLQVSLYTLSVGCWSSKVATMRTCLQIACSVVQVIQWMQNPTELTSLRDFQEWKEKCDVKGQPYCSLPNPCPLTTRELPGQTIRLFTCMECPNNYPWILDPTGDGFSAKQRLTSKDCESDSGLLALQVDLSRCEQQPATLCHSVLLTSDRVSGLNV